MTPGTTAHDRLAERLWQAGADRRTVEPLSGSAAAMGLDASAANAYAIQRINRDRRLRAGDRVVGRKIGLTSPSVQKQLGVDSPDFGNLWASGCHGDGGEVPMAGLIQPKVEAEVALVLGRDVTDPHPTVASLIAATDFALPALEIVDSRIADWRIGLFDTIADNASAAAFVLGGDAVPLTGLRLREAAMTMARNGTQVSTGVGSACLGHPLNAAVWLARELARLGEPLRRGDIVLTGALGPMVPAAAGDTFEANVTGLGSVSVSFV